MDIRSANSRRLNKPQQEQNASTQSNSSWTRKSIISLVLFILVLASSFGFILKETEWLIQRGSPHEYRLWDEADSSSAYNEGRNTLVRSGALLESENQSKTNATSNSEQASSSATSDSKYKSQTAWRAVEPKQNQEEEGSKNHDDHSGSSKSPNENIATNQGSSDGQRTSNPIRTFSFPEENKTEYEEIMKPARVLTSRANLMSQKMDDLHAVATDMDKTRARLPPNAVSRHIPTPETVSVDFHRKRHDNFLWGASDFRKQLKDWQRSRCINESRLYVNSTDIDQSLGRINATEALVQRSFQLQHVTYKDELYERIFSKKGKVFEYPYCDLRKCPQHRFPFIYLLVPHRNRVGNLLRFVSSVRNATLRCNEPPPWYHCLCIYVSDYDTDEKVPLASELEHAWRDRVRLLSRSPATYHWIKTQTYNSALRYIPTPSTRSLVFHVDADMVATDSSFVDRGLATTLVGKRVSFPKVMGTKSPIQDSDQLFQHAIKRTLMNNENAWIRAGGYGMTWFYLFDDNVGFFGSTINKTTWGGEDNLFYVHFFKSARKHEMKMPSRYLEESLWHIWHKQFMNWRKSKDGISVDHRKRNCGARGLAL